MAQKGTAENPFTLEELQGAIVPPEQLGKIVIMVNKKHHKVDLRRENISLKEAKDILRNVLNKL
jgi:hypothetical protein